jgi:uncharacterized membrane protein
MPQIHTDGGIKINTFKRGLICLLTYQMIMRIWDILAKNLSLFGGTTYATINNYGFVCIFSLVFDQFW